MKKLIILLLFMNTLYPFVKAQTATQEVVEEGETTPDRMKNKKGGSIDWGLQQNAAKIFRCKEGSGVTGAYINCTFWQWLFGFGGNSGSGSGYWATGPGSIYWSSIGGSSGGIGIKVAVITTGDEEGSGGGPGGNPPGWEPPKDNGDGHTDGGNIHPPDSVRTTLLDDGDGNTLCKLCPSILSIRYKVNYLKTHLGFNKLQNNWLLQHSDYLDQLYDLLDDETLWDEETIAIAMINLEVARLDLVDNWDEVLFKQILDIYLPVTLRVYIDVIVPYIKLQYALKSEENPTLKNTFLGKLKLLYLAQEELMHLGLDFAGLFPVVGEIFDVSNGTWYALQGNYFDATLSIVSAIPFYGMIPAGAKIIKDGRKIIMLKKVSGLWHFPRKDLRKLLGLVVGDGKIAHHILPLGKESHPLIQKAADAGFDMNSIDNAIPLNAAIHGTNHAPYSDKVWDAMERIEAIYLSSNQVITPQTAKTELQNLINRIRTEIANNSTIPINNLIF